MTVSKKIVRQLDTKLQINAIIIWPLAQPIDKTMGVDALDVSFMTYESVSREAL